MWCLGSFNFSLIRHESCAIGKLRSLAFQWYSCYLSGQHWLPRETWGKLMLTWFLLSFSTTAVCVSSLIFTRSSTRSVLFDKATLRALRDLNVEFARAPFREESQRSSNKRLRNKTNDKTEKRKTRAHHSLTIFSVLTKSSFLTTASSVTVFDLLSVIVWKE